MDPGEVEHHSWVEEEGVQGYYHQRGVEVVDLPDLVGEVGHGHHWVGAEEREYLET